MAYYNEFLVILSFLTNLNEHIRLSKVSWLACWIPVGTWKTGQRATISLLCLWFNFSLPLAQMTSLACSLWLHAICQNHSSLLPDLLCGTRPLPLTGTNKLTLNPRVELDHTSPPTAAWLLLYFLPTLQRYSHPLTVIFWEPGAEWKRTEHRPVSPSSQDVTETSTQITDLTGCPW